MFPNNMTQQQKNQYLAQLSKQNLMASPNLNQFSGMQGGGASGGVMGQPQSQPQNMNLLNFSMGGTPAQQQPQQAHDSQAPKQNQQRAQPVRKLPPLKVQLSNKEKGYYSNLLQQADPTGENKVGGKEGVLFFKRSGLSVDLLKTIWKIAARTSSDYLNRDEFYIALRLIAYAQNGIQPNEDSIKFNIDVAFPKFEQAPLALPSSEKAKPEVKQEDIAASLPDLDSLNINAFNNIQSLIPSINKSEQEKQQQMMQKQAQQQMHQQQTMMKQQLLDKIKQSPWYISAEDIQKYSKIFDHFDQSKAGLINDEQMTSVFTQTQLPRQVCEKVWELVNPEGDELFNKKMFSMAMHFLFKRKQGTDLPDTIPQEMTVSLDPESFLKQAHQTQQMGVPPQQQSAFQMNFPQTQVPSSASQQKTPVQSPQQDLLEMVSPQQKPPQSTSDSLIDLGGSGAVGSQFNNGGGDSAIKSAGFNFQNQKNSVSQFGGPQMQNQSLQQPAPQQRATSVSTASHSAIKKRQEEMQFLNQVHLQDNQLLLDVQQDNQNLQGKLDELDAQYNALMAKIDYQRQLLALERSKNQPLRSAVDERTKQLLTKKEEHESLVTETYDQIVKNRLPQNDYTASSNLYNNDYSQPSTGQYNYRDSYQAPADSNNYQYNGSSDTYNNYGNDTGRYQQSAYNYGGGATSAAATDYNYGGADYQNQIQTDYNNNYDYGGSSSYQPSTQNNYGDNNYAPQTSTVQDYNNEEKFNFEEEANHESEVKFGENYTLANRFDFGS